MKKLLLTIFLLSAMTPIAAAQKSTSAYNVGDNLFNAGIGVGSPFFGDGYSASLPINPSISYERGVTDEISVGGQLSYASAKYSYSLFGSAYSFKESATYIGARGSYHLGDLIDLDKKFDLYGGTSLGYVVVSVSDDQGDAGSAGSAVGFGAFGGGKYFFSTNTGVYAEVGYQSLAFLNIGLTFKF